MDSMKKWRELIRSLRSQWKQLWCERIEDKLRAEGIASDDFEALFVEKGTVIIATKDYKPLEFREIVETYSKLLGLPFFDIPSPQTGGWRKFGKEISKSNKSVAKKRPISVVYKTKKSKKTQHLKKGGRGWLHIS